MDEVEGWQSRPARADDAVRAVQIKEARIMTAPSNAVRDRAVTQINCTAAKCTALCPLCDAKCQLLHDHKGKVVN